MTGVTETLLCTQYSLGLSICHQSATDIQLLFECMNHQVSCQSCQLGTVYRRVTSTMNRFVVLDSLSYAVVA